MQPQITAVKPSYVDRRMLTGATGDLHWTWYLLWYIVPDLVA